jgi:hypothetical protein
MGAMLTMLTTGIKSGPSSGVLENGNGNGGNASAGSKGSTAGKPPGGISSSSKKVKNYKPETRSIIQIQLIPLFPNVVLWINFPDTVLLTYFCPFL